VRAAELAVVLDRAAGLRLAAAERLAAALPGLVGEGLLGVDLHLSPAGTFTALARAAGDLGPVRRRLAFWCARAGGRSLDLADLEEPDRAAFRTNLARCQRSATAEPGAVAAEARRLFTAAGAPADRPAEEPLPQLALEVGGAEWNGLRWEPGREQIFLPGELAPVPGDELWLCLRPADAPSLRTRARVTGVRPPEEAEPGAPPGFALGLVGPSPEILLLLDQQAEGGGAGYEKRRAHPRYPVRAAAHVAPAGSEDPGDAPAGEGHAPRFLLENISLGGAFVRTAEPLPRETDVLLACTLPTGDAVRLEGRVVFSSARGMGLRWQLDPRAEQDLAAVVARIAARPRRALVVDDDELFRRMISDALLDRGFEVVCAEDGAAGLQILSEELLSLDLLLVDLKMPRMDGEALLRTVRGAGGEGDLAIAVVSGKLEPGLEGRLKREGADGILQKELGPRFIAQAASAILERKRSAQAGS
jgi:CheY-like chemotaxis protein